MKNFINWLFGPYLEIYSRLNKNKIKVYDCITNDKKASLVADHFINNLYTAFLLSKNLNAEFFFILEPSLYSSSSQKEYLNIDNQTKLRNLKVFNLIFEKVNKTCERNNEFCESFTDGRSWLNIDDKVFIDDAHLSSKGNKVIAENIIQLFKKRFK